MQRLLPTLRWGFPVLLLAGMGTTAFGACLETATNGATGGGTGWTAVGDNNCTTANNTAWHGIGTTATKIASNATIGDSDGTVTLRFGIKIPASQVPGAYQAPVIMEVVAPNS